MKKPTKIIEIKPNSKLDGKTFAMGFKKLFLGYYGDPIALTFSNSDDYVFNSLSEKKSQDNPKSPTETPPNNSKNPSPEPNSNAPE